MTVNNSRSLSGSLTNGSTEGKYRRVRPDTEVVDAHGDSAIRAERASLHAFYNYDYITQEYPAKVNPGGL